MSTIKPLPEHYKEPSLRRWRVIEVESKTGERTRHVYGHDVTNGAGRASSSIREFDLETMTVVTKSGKRYKLLGVPGQCRVGEQIWQRWCAQYGVVSEWDVTFEYFNADALFHNLNDETGGRGKV